MRIIKQGSLIRNLLYASIALIPLALLGCAVSKNNYLNKGIFAIQQTEQHGGINYVYQAKKRG